MTPEHKALVARLREFDAVMAPYLYAEAADVIEALAAYVGTLEAELENHKIALEATLARAEAAEERAEALLAELRAKETEIETLAAKLDEKEKETP